ncbi:MAG TPA: hypothetical protein PKE51_06015, partial [Gemmatimonadaceae bacterium]|nr:hypothetical protein [Gemmatimonadaceae bacterium]
MARPRTIIFTAAGLLLGLLLVALGAVAGLTQTDRGRAVLRGAVLPLARAAIPGRLHLGTIGGNLFTTLTIDSLELTAPDGTLFLRTGPVRVSYDPRDLLARRVVVRHARVERPVINLVDYGNDDWNWKRALRRPGREPSPARAPGGFGSWIRIDSLDLIEGNIAVRDPWRPVDSLRGARRDSAIRFNLARRDLEIRREDDRLVKVRRWMRVNAALGPSRLAHPDSAGLRFAVRHVSAVENDPLFWFRHVSGTFRLLQDSLWVDTARVELARSGGEAWGKLVWGSGLPMRWDLRLRGDSVAFSDIAWISPVLPHVGGGRTQLHIRNDPRNLRIMEYVLTDMDARALRSRLRGRMTFAVGDTVLRIADVGLDLTPVHTDLLRWMNAEPFPYDWRGAITGRVDARGGPVTRFQLDRADLAYADEHVPGAITRGAISGELDVYEPAFAVFKGAELQLEQLDLRTPRFVNPLFPEVNGFVSGTMVLDSVWTDVRFSRAQLQHRDGPGDTTFVNGAGRITLLDDATAFDVDMNAAPLSFTTLSRSYPTLPLRGRAVGPIRAAGIAEDFTVTTALAGPGGEIVFTGSGDAFEPDFRATGRLRLTGGNLRALLGDTLLPPTSLGVVADVDLKAESLATLAGTLHARLAERSSSVGNVPLYAATAALRFGDGLASVDTLTVESAAFRASATGAFGLVASRRDTVRVRLDADSLGGIRDLAQWTRLMAATPDSGAPLPVAGALGLRLAVAGSLDTLDATGVHVAIDAEAREVRVGGAAAAQATLTATLDDVLRAAHGDARVVLDSAVVGGVVASSAIATTRFADAVPSAFSLEVRTEADATVDIAGGATRDGDTTRVLLTRFDVRTPDP